MPSDVPDHADARSNSPSDAERRRRSSRESNAERRWRRRCRGPETASAHRAFCSRVVMTLRPASTSAPAYRTRPPLRRRLVSQLEAIGMHRISLPPSHSCDHAIGHAGSCPAPFRGRHVHLVRPPRPSLPRSRSSAGTGRTAGTASGTVRRFRRTSECRRRSAEVAPARRQEVAMQASRDDHEALEPHADVHEDRHDEHERNVACAAS